jgi:hypothetical protein
MVLVRILMSKSGFKDEVLIKLLPCYKKLFRSKSPVYDIKYALNS